MINSYPLRYAILYEIVLYIIVLLSLKKSKHGL